MLPNWNDIRKEVAQNYGGKGLTPKDTIMRIIDEANQLRERAEQELTTGIHANSAPIVGDLLVKVFAPHGMKGLTRYVGSSARKASKSSVNTRWRQMGSQFLSQCETSIKDISVNVHNLPPRGNSSKLLIKFNRVRRIKNAVTNFSTLIDVLEEIRSLDLIWNRDIPNELAKRKMAAEQERKERRVLCASSPKLVHFAQTIDIYNRLSIAEKLKLYPNIQKTVLGALDSLNRGGPDAERQCITSCRASIEALCIQIGANGNWKTALNKIFPSETDRKAIKAVWSYLSGKGAHGGHTPTKDEAEFGFKITIATLEQIAYGRRDIK